MQESACEVEGGRGKKEKSERPKDSKSGRDKMVPPQRYRLSAAAMMLLACNAISLSSTTRAENTKRCNDPEDPAACHCCPSTLSTQYANKQLSLEALGSQGCVTEGLTQDFSCDLDSETGISCNGTTLDGVTFTVGRLASGDVEMTIDCGVTAPAEDYRAISMFACPTCSETGWTSNSFDSKCREKKYKKYSLNTIHVVPICKRLQTMCVAVSYMSLLSLSPLLPRSRSPALPLPLPSSLFPFPFVLIGVGG